MWLYGSKGSRTPINRRTFRAQDLGQRHDAPTTDDDEEDYELYSKKHGNEAHELHRREDALHDAWRDEEDLKLRELMQAKEWAPSTPTPPNGSRKAPSPDSVLYPPDSPPLSSLRGAASKTTKNRRPSSGPRKTHGQSLHTAGVPLQLENPPSLPNGTAVFTPTSLEGITRAQEVQNVQLMAGRSLAPSPPEKFVPRTCESFERARVPKRLKSKSKKSK